MEQPANTFHKPYTDSITNLMYNMLFCDDLDLYKSNAEPPYDYPFSTLFSDESTVADLQTLIDDNNADPRIKLLAYNRQRAQGHQPAKRELIAVIVEVGLEEGLDVLSSFNDGTARYINQTGKLLIWETTTDAKANELGINLFSNSINILNRIGPWDKPRLPHPVRGNTRITFLVSDGLYFGEAPTGVLFSDQLAGPALSGAVQLLQYITEKSLEQNG